MKWRFFFNVILVLFLSGCGLLPEAATRPADLSVTPSEAQTSQTSFAATHTSVPPPALAVTSVQSDISLPQSQPAEPVRYRIQMRLDYDNHLLQAAQTIRGISPARVALTELLLVVEPGRAPGVFLLNDLTYAGVRVERYTLADGLLRIPLDLPLQPAAQYELGLSYELRLPQNASWLGYTARQLNLGDWHPFVPAYRDGVGWLVHEPGPAGEHLVYPRADFTVGLELLPAAQPLVVAASASPLQVDGAQYTYSLTNARAFAFSISPYFETNVDEVVTTYTFTEHRLAAEAVLTATRDALALYSDLFGGYPYPGLALVEGDFFDGMEYSGLFFLGVEYFAAYPGNSQSYLTALAAHETAHQWWFSQVGNDPALEPWLDEALCTYAELLYYEKYHRGLVDWWWFYRINRYSPQGMANTTIYQHPFGFRSYVDAVYLRGALFLDDLRTAMGDEAFVAFLRDYTAQGSGRVVTTEDFIQIIRAHTAVDVAALAQPYFQPR